MELNETLDTYLERASFGLRQKMIHSIDLICKAYKLAIRYDSENGYWLNFSGGKDSQALYHITQLAQLQHIRGGQKLEFKGHFAPTSVDPPEVIRFIRKKYPDVEFLPLTKSIYQVAVEKSILPSMNIRWCCAEFKESTGAGKVNLIGIRHEESARRAKRNEVEIKSRKFSGNLEQFNQYRADKHFNPTKRGRKPKEERPKEFHPYTDAMEESLSSCINGKDSILISPIIDWSDKDVWEFLNDVVKVPHCSLYDSGHKRIGCICCPMSSPKQKLKELEEYPYVKDKWLQAIKEIRKIGGGEKAECPKAECNSGIHKGIYRSTKGTLAWQRKTLSGIWKTGGIIPDKDDYP